MSTISRLPVMAEVLGRRANVRPALSILLGSVVVALSAQLEIELAFSPVPITGQTFAVLLVAALLGARGGAAAMLLYVAQGAIGLPVFAGLAGGAQHLAGPTGGYLVGFVVAAWIVGALSERGWDRHVISTLAAMTIGTIVILLFGAAWLTVLFGFDSAITFGVIPFLPGGALKIALAAALLPVGWRALAWLEGRRG